jgi:hypothetical protein
LADPRRGQHAFQGTAFPGHGGEKLEVCQSINQDLGIVTGVDVLFHVVLRLCRDDLFLNSSGVEWNESMTWHTPYGDRCLVGEEAELVRESIASMLQELANSRETDESPWEYGITLFDELTWQQQLAVLDQLALNLLCETETTLELTGVVEAGVAAIYQNVVQQIELEIELHDVSPSEFRCRWRQAAFDALIENEDHEIIERESERFDPDLHAAFDEAAESMDLGHWRRIVESLADRVLWDRDFELVNEMIDAPPEKATALRAALGIQPGYYVAIAPDPTEHQIDALFRSIDELVRSKPR